MTATCTCKCDREWRSGGNRQRGKRNEIVIETKGERWREREKERKKESWLPVGVSDVSVNEVLCEACDGDMG